jgi:hypothetical protein
MVDRSYLGGVGDEPIKSVPDEGVGVDARPQGCAPRLIDSGVTIS